MVVAAVDHGYALRNRFYPLLARDILSSQPAQSVSSATPQSVGRSKAPEADLAEGGQSTGQAL